MKTARYAHFYGPTHRYLTHPFGDASLSLFDMADNRHSPQLRLLVERAARQNVTVRLEGLEFSKDGATDSVNVTVTPVVEPTFRRETVRGYF